MLTAEDISKRTGLTIIQVAKLHSQYVLPEPVRIGGQCRWREQDIAKFIKYLRRRIACRQRGIDPDSMAGPSPPVYSTGGEPRTDPRLIKANAAERQRQKRSRTLAAGSVPIPQQTPITLPEPNATIAQTRADG